jgi:hypothetical protein
MERRKGTHGPGSHELRTRARDQRSACAPQASPDGDLRCNNAVGIESSQPATRGPRPVGIAVAIAQGPRPEGPKDISGGVNQRATRQPEGTVDRYPKPGAPPGLSRFDFETRGLTPPANIGSALRALETDVSWEKLSVGERCAPGRLRQSPMAMRNPFGMDLLFLIVGYEMHLRASWERAVPFICSPLGRLSSDRHSAGTVR